MNKKIISGKNPIIEALQANLPLTKIFIARGVKKATSNLIKRLASQSGIPLRELARTKLTELVGHEDHQGIVAILSQSPYGTIDDILTAAHQRNEPLLIAILDEIQDPHNLGAIIRSADAFGIHGIIIPKHRSVGLTETVAKTSAGAISHIAVARVTNLAQTIEELKQKGLWIVGADQTSTQKIDELDVKLPLGIVIGSEGKGIRRLVKEKCDLLIQIPMYGKINSLNASVAAAVIFWEIRRQRGTMKQEFKF